MLTADFLAEFKRATETRWSERSIDPALYGFQFQPGTRWNPSLSDEGIAETEPALALIFPRDFRTFLQEMSGTDQPTLLSTATAVNRRGSLGGCIAIPERRKS